MTTPESSVFARSALRVLADAIASGTNPTRWWSDMISPVPLAHRKIFLRELANLISKEMRGISKLAQLLSIDKKRQPGEFDCILYEFLMPLHDLLVTKNFWEEALNLELTIYTFFIKQDENYVFYENAFSALYSPYLKIFDDLGIQSSSDYFTQKINEQNEKKTDGPSSDGPLLFWFQNYSVLAHTQLALDLASHLSAPRKIYVSALSNANLEATRSLFSEAGVEILAIDERKNLSVRCNDLVQVCKSKGISNIVFVSIPLQSGYIRSICEEIQLTWWSMKYPLGCMRHFDRLVCNRALYPNKKIFNGAMWYCAPFAVKPILQSVEKKSINFSLDDLKIGVLSREEKFASSDLPEVLHRSLALNHRFQLFWTGRTHDKNLDHRLHSSLRHALKNRIHFCGWVSPAKFLTQIDVLVDTPNLGGMVAYWMMSLGKVVLSATDYGSVGALGSRQDIREHFELLTNSDQVRAYFSSASDRPFYLSSADLIPQCIEEYCQNREVLDEHGRRFLLFFNNVLSDLDSYSRMTYKFLQGQTA